MGMRRIIVPALVVLTLLIGMIPGAAAQEEPTLSDMDLAGLQKVYSRAFAADMMSMMDPDGADAMPSGWWSLMTLVYEFDSADAARAGAETIAPTSAAGDETSLEQVELDLDDLNYTAQGAEDGMTSMLMVTAQDGPYIYAVVGLTFGDDPAPLVESVVLSMRDAEVADDAETFHENGTSMGGLWAKLPIAEDVTSRAEALTVVVDTVYYPMAEATPSA